MFETEKIREYTEAYPVKIVYLANIERWAVDALNEGGYNGTSVDLVDLLKFVKENLPEVWKEI